MASVSSVILIPYTPIFSSQLGKELMSLRNDEQFRDFTITSGQQKFSCHRLMLAANSPVLKAMLKSNMDEANKKEIPLNNISPEVLKVVLQYMYTGEGAIPEGLLKDFIEAADYLDLPQLKKFCIEQVPSVLKPINAISWFRFSEKIPLKDAQLQCSDILVSDFDQVYKGNEFLELSYFELSRYFTDLKEKNIDADDMLDAALLWVNHDSDARGPKLEKIINLINLNYCSVQCLKEHIDQYAQLLPQYQKVYQLLVRIALVISLSEYARKRRSGFQIKAFLPVVVGGGCEAHDLNDQYWYLSPNDSFSDFCKVPSECCHLKSSFCKTFEGFILTGGEDSDIAVMFTTKTKSWKRLKNLRQKRYGHGSVFVKGVLIICGGDVGRSITASVELFDMELGTWQDGPALPKAIFRPEVCSITDGVFLLEENGDFYFMDARRTKWKKRRPCPVRSHGARMIPLNDQLCVVGGYDKTHVWYTPSTDTWTEATQPLHEHGFAAVLHIGNDIMILGGDQQDAVEKYNLESKSWSICAFKVPKRLINIHGLVLDIVDL